MIIRSMALFSIASQVVQSCPEVCRCDTRNKVYCNNRNLREIPENIPEDTKVLFLQDNQLENTNGLERELGKLTKLERLMFYNNNLETIPKMNSINLRELRLNNNRIKTISSRCFTDAPNLSELILDGNNLTNAGISLGAFRTLSNLKRISFTNNHLTEFPVDLPESLNHVFLSDNQISYVSNRAVSNLVNTETLYLNRNRLSDVSFERGSLASLTQLRELEVSYNLLNHIPHDLQSSLVKLHMTSNKLEYIRVGEFKNLENLRQIDVAYNRLRAIENGTLQSLGALDRIDLSGNNWNCDCYLKSLKIYLNENAVHKGIREPIMCGDSEHVGTKLDFLHPDSLQCKEIAFNITTDENGLLSVHSDHVSGIIPPFGEYVLKTDEHTMHGLNATSSIGLRPPAHVTLTDLRPGTKYRVCLFNRYDLPRDERIPDRFCKNYKTPQYLSIDKAVERENDELIGMVAGLIVVFLLLTAGLMYLLRKKNYAGCVKTNHEKNNLPDASLEKSYRLCQGQNMAPFYSQPAMTLDASKEFNVTLMLRNPESRHPISQMGHSGPTTKMHKSEYNVSRDSGIYSNMRHNSLTGSTTTGSEETDKTLLHSSRTDLGIYL